MTAAAAPSVTFKTRPIRDGDKALVFNSFLKSMRDEDAFRGIGNGVFYSTMTVACESMLAHFTVLIAHPESDDEEMAGYLIYKADAIGFLYVRRDPWRRMGVSRTLLEASRLSARATLRVLFPTARGLKLARLKGIDVRPCLHIEAMALLARAV
jgi:hypothetical protein